MKKTIFAFMLLVSLSFSSLLWQSSVGGEVLTKPLSYGNYVVVGSGNGDVYALTPESGSLSWRTSVGTNLLDFVIFDGELVAATTEGKIDKIKPNGEKSWEIDLAELYNVTYIYGIDSNSKNVYVAASDGIYTVSKGGAAERIYAVEEGSILTPPTAVEDYVVFGAENKLIKLDGEGKEQWVAEIGTDNFWKSRPVVGDSTIYIGALDNKLHAYHLTRSYERWSVTTDGWVLSTPLLIGETVYFGSNDGNVYAVDTNSEISDGKHSFRLPSSQNLKRGRWAVSTLYSLAEPTVISMLLISKMGHRYGVVLQWRG